jgi:hypothetical protein
VGKKKMMAKERGFNLSHADGYEINWPGNEVAKFRMVGSHKTGWQSEHSESKDDNFLLCSENCADYTILQTTIGSKYYAVFVIICNMACIQMLEHDIMSS